MVLHNWCCDNNQPGILIFSGLNFGVDFTGGTLLQLAFEEDVTVQDVKDVLRSEELDEFQLGGSFIQKTGGKMLIRTRELNEVEKARVFEAIRSRLGEFEDLGSQTVGPVVGRELATSAVKALIVASVLIVGYISVRFEFKSGVTAVLALLHDVILVAGIFPFQNRGKQSFYCGCSHLVDIPSTIPSWFSTASVRISNITKMHQYLT